MAEKVGPNENFLELSFLSVNYLEESLVNKFSANSWSLLYSVTPLKLNVYENCT